MVLSSVAVARRDAGVEPTGKYSRRVTEMSTEFMSITELLRSNATVAIRFKVEVNRVMGQQWGLPLVNNANKQLSSNRGSVNIAGQAPAGD